MALALKMMSVTFCVCNAKTMFKITWTIYVPVQQKSVQTNQDTFQ